MKSKKILKSLVLITSILLLGACASNGSKNASSGGDDNVRKLVIQVSTDDARTQKIAMNNAVNVQKELGVDNVMVEIVAYGPGLSMLTANSKNTKRVASLAVQGITFSACNNTMKKIAKKKGKTPKLTEGVKIVPAGVIRIMKLQEQGYSYIRP